MGQSLDLTTMSDVVNINGQIHSRDTANINIFDRGFLFGDSIYEVIRTYKKYHLFLFNAHYERLLRSAKKLFLNHPFTKEEIIANISTTLKEANNPDSYIRIIITRGESDPNLDFSNVRNPKLIIIVRPLPRHAVENAAGLHLFPVSVRRNPTSSFDPSIKSGNYLNNLLAYHEAKAAGADDAILLNQNGFVTESSTSNVFFCKNGMLKTPSIRVGILHGVTRQLIIDLARKNTIPFEEGEYTIDDLTSADEIFISSTIREIHSVQKFNNTLVNDGSRGPMTTDVQRLFSQEVETLVTGSHS